MRTTCSTTLAAVLVWMLPFNSAVAQEQGGKTAQDESKPAAQKAAGQTKALPNCPVMGETIDFNVKAMTDDGPVYFCCDMCVAKYKKEPAKYAEKLATQRADLAKLDRVQVSCPIDGKGVDGKLAAEIGGQTVAFCSKDCQAKYTEKPGAFKAKLADSYTYQTRCPISGERVQPNAMAEVGGHRVYFCCTSCADKLLKDPAKYAPKLAEQGVPIDPKAIPAPNAKPKHDDHAGHKHP